MQEVFLLEIHERIRKLRELQGLKQNQMAELLKMPANTYNGYETGKRKIDANLLKDISDILNCSVDYLLDRTDIRNPEQYKNLDKPAEVALHRTDGYEKDFPPEALEEIDDYINYL